ncbi:hypothetical protein [Clostridium gasigenes]|uniref:Uncharacterized protein n=1 Tax=Clostridium gasigenes TaxID=94869 RepID=A0A1H0S2Z4_9CLOT|nr:hypothetical protein [Clostridium gasigenes]SDP35618.1 hypothetical protein SAMN04488529_104118 [Clostridium gasigenes]
MKKYIFTNLKNGEMSFIKAGDEEEAIEKMAFKHINMGLGGITYGMIKDHYKIEEKL